MTADRRDFLKGTTLEAGAMVLAPLAQQLQAQTAGTAAPRWLLFVVEGNGTRLDSTCLNGPLSELLV